jgi:hypothetical protein
MFEFTQPFLTKIALFSCLQSDILTELIHLVICRNGTDSVTYRRVPSIISFISLEFCLILLMTLGISSKIGVLKVGPI